MDQIQNNEKAEVDNLEKDNAIDNKKLDEGNEKLKENVSCFFDGVFCY